MKYYDVLVERVEQGKIRVWASSPEEAFKIAQDTDADEWDVSWGSCGDYTEVFNDVEEAWMPERKDLWS